MAKKQDIIVYQAKNGAIELRGDFSQETFWATQAQIVQLFSVDQSVVSRHISNVFKDKEVDPKSNMQKMHIANSDKPVVLYSLDVILSVGYRVNSKIAIEFRKWATKTLKGHIFEGYTINPRRITKNYQQFLRAVDDVKKILPAGSLLNPAEALDLAKLFAGTWFSLDAYDKATLPKSGASKKQVDFTADELTKALAALKQSLLIKKEATHFFAQEKQSGNLAGIVGNVFQSIFGKDAYPTVEEKAAHLLYFIVKNHPFNDGNKRSGAFAFVWFLRKAGLLNPTKLSPEALTVLTLLIAESNPKEKERLIGLVLLLLKKR